MAKRATDPDDVLLLLPERAGVKPDAASQDPAGGGLLVEEPGRPMIIVGGRGMREPSGAADPCAAKGRRRLVH
jgi:hypothetical protein